MNFKVSILAVTLSSSFMANCSDAHGHQLAHGHKPIQIYAGLSGGIELMRGKRNDSANEQGAAPGSRFITTFANNINLNNTNVLPSIFAGLWWKLSSSILVGPEVFFGRGNTTSSVKDSRFDALAVATRAYSADFQRRYFYGALIRAGYNLCKSYTLYLGVGYEQGQFKAIRMLTVDPANPAPGTPTSFANRTKWLSGLLLGFGIEKKIECFVAGLDFRMSHYNKFSISDGLIVNPGVQSGWMDLSAKPRMYQFSLRIGYHF